MATSSAGTDLSDPLSRPPTRPIVCAGGLSGSERVIIAPPGVRAGQRMKVAR